MVVTPDRGFPQNGDAGGAAMNWRGAYVLGAAYAAKDVVRDGAWAMVANKATSDRAAPQAAGDPVFDRPDAPGWSQGDFSGRVIAGTRYLVTSSGWLTGIDVWNPFDGDTAQAPVAGILNVATGETRSYALGTLDDDVWRAVPMERVMLPAGSEIIAFFGKTSGEHEAPVTANWAKASDGGAPPASGEYRTSGGASLRIHKIDASGADRGDFLMTLAPGAEIRSVYPAEPNRSETFILESAATDEGAYVRFDMTRIESGTWGAPYSGLVCALESEVLAPGLTPYVVEAGWWAGDQPSWATASGVLHLNGAAQGGVENNAYGVRVAFQEAYISPDWDLLAAGATAGASGALKKRP